MEINRITCGKCLGDGHTIVWKMVDMNNNIGTIQSEEVICEQCGGRGFIEYPVFSVEEAKAILKFCGLSTES